MWPNSESKKRYVCIKKSVLFHALRRSVLCNIKNEGAQIGDTDEKLLYLRTNNQPWPLRRDFVPSPTM